MLKVLPSMGRLEPGFDDGAVPERAVHGLQLRPLRWWTTTLRGDQFAMLEAVTAMSVLLKKFDFGYCDVQRR